MSELSEHAILWNSAALTSLKRAQLVSLSKRYGLKANGKNTEIVQRLYDFGQGLTPGAKGRLNSTHAQDASESPSKHLQAEDETSPNSLGPLPLTIPTLPSVRSIKRQSEAWEVISTGDSSLVEDKSEEVEDQLVSKGQHAEEEQGSLSTRSWKSADNGAPLDDFGNHKHHELRGVGSLRSLASSFRRTASRTLSARHKDTRSDGQTSSNEEEQQTDEAGPPSPASTIGVPKRHPKALHNRPSTIRLVSPSATETLSTIQRAVSPTLNDELPLTGRNTVDRIRQRASHAPLRSTCPPVSILNQRSLPSILSPATNKTGIYPKLPSLDSNSTLNEILRSDSPEMPGSFPGTPRSPTFVFGTDRKVSNSEFADVGAKLLQEMQAKLNGTGSAFNAELLKGKNAELTKLVNVNAELGASTGGWGLSLSSGSKDRYADSHQREFSRMKSLQSSTGSKAPSGSKATAKRKWEVGASLSTTVNGLPVPASEQDQTDRGTKRTKVAPPTRTNYFSNLRKSVKSPLKSSSAAGPSRLRTLRGTPTGSRFAFLRHKRTQSKGSPDSVTSDGEYVLPASTVPMDGTPPALEKRPTGLQSIRVSTLQQPTASSMSKAARGSVSAQRRSAIPDFSPPKPRYEPIKDHSASPAPTASSASTRPSGTLPERSLSMASSMGTLSRSGHKHNLARMASAEFKASMAESPANLPLPPSVLPKSSSRVSVRPSSVSSRPSTLSRSSVSSRPSTLSRSASSMRPPTTSSKPSTLSRSGSTLLAPTAASLARMQATVKPPEQVRRPLPHPPKVGLAGIDAVAPFGEASSRSNHLFESNFHLEPVKSPFASPRQSALSPRKSMMSPKRPLTHTPSAARRARASGIASLKSSALHDSADVTRRRSELRAKHDRLTQERELRRMLE